MRSALLPDYFSWRYHLLLPILSQLPLTWAYQAVKQQSKFFAQRKQQEAELIKSQMQRVFPEFSELELEQHLDDYFCMVEREALDTFYLDRSAGSELISLDNFEPVLEARKNNQRVILTGGHYGRFWMTGLAMREAGLTTGTITRDGDQGNAHGLHPAEYHYRLMKLKRLEKALGGPFLIEGEHLKNLYKALDKHLITLIFDVPYPEKHRGSVVVPFLGRTIQVPAGIYRIAKKTDARIAPFFMDEQTNGTLIARFDSLLSVEDYDEVGFMTLLASLLEKQIRRRPGHWWLWEALPMLETSDV